MISTTPLLYDLTGDRFDSFDFYESVLAFWAMSASLHAAADGELSDELGDHVRAIDELVAQVPV